MFVEIINKTSSSVQINILKTFIVTRLSRNEIIEFSIDDLRPDWEKIVKSVKNLFYSIKDGFSKPSLFSANNTVSFNDDSDVISINTQTVSSTPARLLSGQADRASADEGASEIVAIASEPEIVAIASEPEIENNTSINITDESNINNSKIPQRRGRRPAVPLTKEAFEKILEFKNEVLSPVIS